jgi:hypothetical protein
MTTGLTYRQTTGQNPTADSKKVYQESNERQEVSYKNFLRRCVDILADVEICRSRFLSACRLVLRHLI